MGLISFCQQSSTQLLGVQVLTLPVALTTTCLQEPFSFRNRTRFPPAVPLGENEMEPVFVIIVPCGNGLVCNGIESR